MRRRDFLLTTAALGCGGAGIFAATQRFTASVDYPGRDAGHWLRDVREWPDVDGGIDTEVLIAGSGIGGLTAAWQLHKLGVRDVLLVNGPEPHGNAAAGHDGPLSYPTGAHSLPLPSAESRHIREMLADFEIIRRDPYGERPTFDDRFLVHAPAKRVLYQGAWHEGCLPEPMDATERAERARFFALLDWYRQARGSDGRRAFAVPLELSSRDQDFRMLDQLSFRAWLDHVEVSSPALLWHLDVCCRDDYGRHLDEISAWAGLFHFCSRDGAAANAEPGAVLSWPQGLAALAERLETAGDGRKRAMEGSVARLQVRGDRVEALVAVPGGQHWRTVRVKARRAIAAMPLFVLQHVYPEIAGYGFVNHKDVPRYAPWMVSNFVLRSLPQERSGVPLSQKNVVFQAPGLGYIASTQQDRRLGPGQRTTFTGYHAFSDREPDAARRWLEQAGVAELTRVAAADLRLAYGWRLPWNVERVAMTVRAHGTAIPEPGFLTNYGRTQLRETLGPILFAHSDLSGLSLFEEAAWWGYVAAKKIAAAR